MKKLLLLLVAGTLIQTTNTFAKTPPAQGTIRYDMILELRKQVAKENPMIAQMVPEQQHMDIIVVYKGDTYSVEQKEAASSGKQNAVSAAVSMAINTSASGRSIVNFKTGISRGEYEFRNKNFYTEEKMKPAVITYSNETKVIQGYTCYKATTTLENERATIWYCKDFPFAYTPDETLFGIKGAVLEYSTGTFTVRAVSITPAFNATALVPTNPSKKITKEQLADLQEEQQEEMTKKATQNARRSGSQQQQTQTKTIIIK